MKKILISVISFVMLFISVNALTIDEIGENLKKLEIVNGYEDGDLRFNNYITRAEIAAIVVRIMESKGINESASELKFDDLKPEFWGNKYIYIVNNSHIMTGFPDNTFKPGKNITYGEVLTILVRLVGKDNNLSEETWPYNYFDKSLEIGIINEELIKNMNDNITRGEVFKLIWNTIKIEL
ncbi:MAG: S-layer homology domain-containing protein [Clostridia bacterium]|jgi:hypothetical protein|nr:S-layer homology domain-containing protein [Clostridia bacterium]